MSNETSNTTNVLIHNEQQLENVLDKLKKDRYTHNMASNYYEKLNYRIIFPSVFITGISSIAAFLATSEQVPNETKQYFSLMIGILTSASAILQSLSGACGFETRKELFKKAALGYDELINKTIFEMNNPNEPNFFDTIEEEMKKIKSNCNYLPPTWIIDKWDTRDVEKCNDKGIVDKMKIKMNRKKKKRNNDVEYIDNSNSVNHRGNISTSDDDEYTHYRTFNRQNGNNGNNGNNGSNSNNFRNNTNQRYNVNISDNDNNNSDNNIIDGILQARNIDLNSITEAVNFVNNNSNHIKPKINNLTSGNV
jgi:hypothetical protein